MFLKVVAAGSALLAWPSGCARGFLTDSERRTLAALADGILPPDDQPGGAALGAVDYIEALCTALDGATPTVLRGGPYSGRAPFANDDGSPSAVLPSDGFSVALPLDRVAARAWQLRLSGLRDQLRQGLAAAEGKRFDDVDPDFLALLYPLVCEAAFGAPEYGGNPGGAGWAMVHFEGDLQPLGFSFFDESAQRYVERAAQPVTTADPDGDPEPLDDDTRKLLDEVIAALGGKRFA